MKLNFLLLESVLALRSNKLRSFLTVIGIIVGIFSVTAMLALGEGLSANLLDRFSSFAQGDITVSGATTYRDLEWVKELPYVKNALATQQISGAGVVAFEKDYTPSVKTVMGDYAEVQKFTVVSGSTFDFSDRDFSDHVILVSDGFADLVKKDTGQSVLGQDITVGGQKFTVQGVIKSNAMEFTRGDGLILVPYGAAVSVLSSTKAFSSIAVLLKDSGTYEVAGKHILGGLNASRSLALDSDDEFAVESAKAFIESAQQTTAMLTLFLGVIGGIALFVGGIGTMNMMLTTVTERTQEIGLRKAIGARDNDILLQILVESIILTTFGGLVGILLSLGAAQIANKIFADSEIIHILVDTKVIILAVVVSFIVGVVFGVYPARSASRLQPVDALRAE